METVRYDVLSYVDNDFVKTTVSRVVSNPANISKGDYIYFSNTLDLIMFDLKNTFWRSDYRKPPSYLTLRLTITRLQSYLRVTRVQASMRIARINTVSTTNIQTRSRSLKEISAEGSV